MNAISHGGALLVLAGVALYSAVRAARVRDRRRLWLSFAVAFPLAAVSCLVLWFGIRNPDTNIWRNVGLGPDWVCRNLGSGAAKFCTQDLPPYFQGRPQEAGEPRQPE